METLNQRISRLYQKVNELSSIRERIEEIEEEVFKLASDIEDGNFSDLSEYIKPSDYVYHIAHGTPEMQAKKFDLLTAIENEGLRHE